MKIIWHRSLRRIKDRMLFVSGFANEEFHVTRIKAKKKRPLYRTYLSDERCAELNNPNLTPLR